MSHITYKIEVLPYHFKGQSAKDTWYPAGIGFSVRDTFAVGKPLFEILPVKPVT